MILALGLLLLLAGLNSANAQTNFRPLERGEYNEVEEKLVVIRGLEASAEYALRVRALNGDDLAYNQKGTDTYQDLRLKLRTLFHRDVSINLNLELAQGDISETRLREADPDNRGRLRDSGQLYLNVREAYLRYNFNPRSGMIFGKHELSLADRRGKVYDAIAPGVTMDCQMGTWCFPFGLSTIGEVSGDSLFHIALQYTGWDEKTEGGRELLEVEVYRLLYNEGNVPLAKNLGPGQYNPDDPDTGTDPDPSQLIDGTTPVYYDADGIEYYGFRMVWEQEWFFLNFDVTSAQGSRKYHRYRHPLYGISGSLSTGISQSVQSIKGVATEAEIGLNFSGVRMGLRFMNATGDPFVDPSDPDSFLRELKGYYEITPGTYKGSRLYFNGGDSNITDGAGLGHSVNNTRLAGFFLDVDAKEKRKISYHLGLYALSKNHSIQNAKGDLVDNIGIEMNNVLAWHVHKALRFEVEANAILAGDALTYDDHSIPPSNPDDFIQALSRVVYSF